MKRFTLIMLPLLALITMTGCGENSTGNTDCGTFDGNTLYKDSGGCYWMDGQEKIYISSTACNC